MSDEQILEKVLSKDPEGLKLLEARYGSFIRYIVKSVLAEFPEEIEECMNDLWLKFWNVLPGYEKEKASLKTFLARVARNVAFDRRKLIQRRNSHVELKEEIETDAQREFVNENPTEENMLKKEQKEHLYQALRMLSQKDLNMFLRKYYYLQTTEQIAAETGQTRRAVENRLARIKKKLAATLEEVK